MKGFICSIEEVQYPAPVNIVDTVSAVSLQKIHFN